MPSWACVWVFVHIIHVPLPVSESGVSWSPSKTKIKYVVSNVENNKRRILLKVHSFLKQCFARSSIDTKLVDTFSWCQLENHFEVPPNCVNWRSWKKHCFKNEWTLSSFVNMGICATKSLDEDSSYSRLVESGSIFFFHLNKFFYM